MKIYGYLLNIYYARIFYKSCIFYIEFVQIRAKCMHLERPDNDRRIFTTYTSNIYYASILFL